MTFTFKKKKKKGFRGFLLLEYVYGFHFLNDF